jgi:hypothetical protein
VSKAICELSTDDLYKEIKRLEGNRYTDSPIDELQYCYVELSKRLQGTKAKCVAEAGHILKEGGIYEFVQIEAGIFSTPYVTVRVPDGRTVSGHDYRFEKFEEATRELQPLVQR